MYDDLNIMSIPLIFRETKVKKTTSKKAPKQDIDVKLCGVPLLQSTKKSLPHTFKQCSYDQLTIHS